MPVINHFIHQTIINKVSIQIVRYFGILMCFGRYFVWWEVRKDEASIQNLVQSDSKQPFRLYDFLMATTPVSDYFFLTSFSTYHFVEIPPWISFFLFSALWTFYTFFKDHYGFLCKQLAFYSRTTILFEMIKRIHK